MNTPLIIEEAGNSRCEVHYRHITHRLTCA